MPSNRLTLLSIIYVAVNYGVPAVDDDVFNVLSVAVQERMKDILEDLARSSKHRAQRFADSKWVMKNDAKRVLVALEKQDREAVKRREELELEQLRVRSALRLREIARSLTVGFSLERGQYEGC